MCCTANFRHQQVMQLFSALDPSSPGTFQIALDVWLVVCAGKWVPVVACDFMYGGFPARISCTLGLLYGMADKKLEFRALSLLA